MRVFLINDKDKSNVEVLDSAMMFEEGMSPLHMKDESGNMKDYKVDRIEYYLNKQGKNADVVQHVYITEL